MAARTLNPARWRTLAFHVVLMAGLLGAERLPGATSERELIRLQSLCRKLIDDDFKLLEAKPAVEELLAVTSELREEVHQDTIIALYWSGFLAYKTKHLVEAQSIGDRALGIDQLLVKKDPFWSVRVLHLLGRIHCDLSQFERAQVLLESALQHSEANLGFASLETLWVVKSLAAHYELVGESKRRKFDLLGADVALHRALKLRERAHGMDDPATARAVLALAGFYKYKGDRSGAELLYRRALEVFDKAPGQEADALPLLRGLGGLYVEMDDLDRAEPLLARALKISQELYGADHLQVATSLHQLSGAVSRRDDFFGARTLLERCLEIRERATTEEDVSIAWTLDDLGLMALHFREFEKAEALFLRSRKLARGILGMNHPDVGWIIYHLGLLYEEWNRKFEARACFENVCQLASGPEAADRRSTITARRDLARMQYAMGQTNAALAGIDQIQTGEEKHMADSLSFSSERQRLQAWNRSFLEARFGLWATMGAARPLARAVLRTKGVVLDSLLEDRRMAEASLDPAIHRLVEGLNASRRQLAQIHAVEVASNRSIDPALWGPAFDRDSITRDLEDKEAALARNVAGLGRARRALSVRVEDIQEVLPVGTALLEFLRYGHYQGRGNWKECYGVLVMLHGQPPQWLSFGEADAIDRRLNLYQHLVRTSGDDGTLPDLLRQLYAQFWSPVALMLGSNTTAVIVSPVGSPGTELEFAL